MISLKQVESFLERHTPRRLAAEWDNVGLLVGDHRRTVERIMTCLTITWSTATEAIDEKADLIIAHHPLPFRPLKQITTATTAGGLLLDLIENRIAIYSPHTAFDSSAAGINQQLAEMLGLTRISPLVSAFGDPDGAGSGRYGELQTPIPLRDLAELLKSRLRVGILQYVGDLDLLTRRVAVACGAAGEYLADALAAGCDTFVTGETNFHTCLEAEAQHVTLLLVGHFASERFGVECLADVLQQEFADLTVWASRREADPIGWL